MNVFEKSVESVRNRGFHEDSASEFLDGRRLAAAQYLRLVEEVGEVGRAMRTGVNVGIELADVVITAANLAYCYDADLELLIDKKLSRDDKRGWQHNGSTLQEEHNVEPGNHPGTFAECHQ